MEKFRGTDRNFDGSAGMPSKVKSYRSGGFSQVLNTLSRDIEHNFELMLVLLFADLKRQTAR